MTLCYFSLEPYIEGTACIVTTNPLLVLISTNLNRTKLSRPNTLPEFFKKSPNKLLYAPAIPFNMVSCNVVKCRKLNQLQLSILFELYKQAILLNVLPFFSVLSKDDFCCLQQRANLSFIVVLLVIFGSRVKPVLSIIPYFSGRKKSRLRRIYVEKASECQRKIFPLKISPTLCFDWSIY